MQDRLIIAVDCMGGDHAPQAMVEGVLLAMKQDPAVSFLLVGREADIRACLPADAPALPIVHAEEVIETGEDPMLAIRRKRNASMLQAIAQVKQGKAQAVVSAGSTGAFLAGALFGLGRVRGVKRPALAPLFPMKNNKQVLLVDCGANADCTAEFLLQFAQMGAAYMRRVAQIENPRVGLINNGAEAEKGSALYKEAHALLQSSSLNFVGNVEPRDLTEDRADVLVCDGFSGNMVLKSYEGAITFLFSMLKREFKRNLFTKLATAVLMPGLRRIKKVLDYNAVGGAPLIGVNGCVVKAHGSSNAQSFAAALAQAATIVRSDVLGNIQTDLEDTQDA